MEPCDHVNLTPPYSPGDRFRNNIKLGQKDSIWNTMMNNRNTQGEDHRVKQKMSVSNIVKWTVKHHTSLRCVIYYTPTHTAFTTSITRTYQATLWHWHLGYAHRECIMKYLWDNHNIILYQNGFSLCDACAMKNLPQSRSTFYFHISCQLLDLLHSDLIGPISLPTQLCAQYILTFVNDHTRIRNTDSTKPWMTNRWQAPL